MTNVLTELERILGELPEEKLQGIVQATQPIFGGWKWLPNPGQQTEALYSEADELFYGGEAGGGKALLNKEKIVTPFGFREIGALKVGDTICAADGTPTKVIGVYPQGVRPLYRVTFQDGASVLADADHRWNYSIASNAWEKSGRKWKVGTTAQLSAMLENGLRPLIPLCGPLKLTKAYKTPQRNIDPYVLGLLLGDGYTKQSGPGAKWSFASIDPEIIASLPGDWVHDNGPNYRLRGPMRKVLMAEFERLGLKGCGAKTKFIPEPYKWGQVSDRLALLQGLMDTDGTSDDRGHTIFCSISKQLAQDVAWLVHSLGGRATITTKETGFELAYTVYIRMADGAEIFRLERKRVRATEYQHGKPKRRIVSIEYERDDEATCIAVDHPDSLYVVGEGCIVTHNTDLLLGAAMLNHRRSLILRRLNDEVSGLIDRMVEIVGHEKGLKRNPPASWRTSNQIIMFGGCQYLQDRKKYQGVPKDLIGFDEVSNFLREQYEFIIAWARSTVPGQRVRVIAAGNPPTTAEGMWVIERWGAWLDKNHPNPALPGELRWYTTINGKDTEVDGPGHVHIDGVPQFDEKGRPIMPKSRTYIPAELSDNPDLEESGYGANLAGLPEELRLAMQQGDFSAAQRDSEWQVFPSEWIDRAMARWTEVGGQQPMDVLAVDVAQGGKDRTVFVARHGKWYARPIVYPGVETPDGPSVAGLVFRFLKNDAEVIIDMGGGYGGSVNDHLKQALKPTLYSGAETAEAMRDKSGIYKFLNMRAAACWSLREALDPDYGSFIALPPDQELKAELASYRWKVVPGSKIQVLPKEEIRQILGRSPDKADALIMAHSAKGKTDGFRNGIGSRQPTRAITSGRNPNRRGRP